MTPRFFQETKGREFRIRWTTQIRTMANRQFEISRLSLARFRKQLATHAYRGFLTPGALSSWENCAVFTPFPGYC